MVEMPSPKKKDKLMYTRVGTGKQAELADIRDAYKHTGEETKEEILAEAIDVYPRSDNVVEKVR